MILPSSLFLLLIILKLGESLLKKSVTFIIINESFFDSFLKAARIGGLLLTITLSNYSIMKLNLKM